MTLSWPADAITDPAANVQRVTQAVDARPGGSIEVWHEHKVIDGRVASIWRAKIVAATDEHLTLIANALTGPDIPTIGAS